MNTYNLTNIVNRKSRNGYSMQATLTVNGKAVCRMNDLGDGSMPDFEVFDKAEFEQLEQDIARLPEMFFENVQCELKVDLCMFIDLLHYALETKTPFTLLTGEHA